MYHDVTNKVERLTKQLTQLKDELEVATEAERIARHNAQDQASKDSERVRLAEKQRDNIATTICLWNG